MNPCFQGVKALLFDFGGTLDCDGVAWKEQFYPLYRAAGLDWPPETFQKLFFAADDALIGRLRNTSYERTVRLQVAGVLKRAGLNRKDIADGITRAYLRQTRGHVRANLPTLRRLKEKYALAIVSNFYGNLARVVRDLGLRRLFPVAIDSVRVRCLKPDPGIFLCALEKLKASAQQAVFIGDSPNRDMLGAKALGMLHIRLVPESRKGEGLSLCCPQDATIGRLRDLEELLL